MKRRDFMKVAGASAVAASVPAMAMSQKRSKPFRHDPKDYALVAEEAEEFQELDEALTSAQFAQDINL